MPYIRLDELPELFDSNWLWSARRWALARFKRSDFLGDPKLPLEQEVRRRIFEETGVSHRGPIYLLANMRYFGVAMNPIACYYCFNEDESCLEYLVAEVNNPPWNELCTWQKRRVQPCTCFFVPLIPRSVSPRS